MVSNFVRYSCLTYLVTTISIVFLDLGSLSTLLKQISEALHADGAESGVLTSLGICGTLFGVLFVAPLSKRFHRLTLIFTGMVIWAGGALLCSFSTNLGVFILGRLIIGFGTAPVSALQPPLVNDLAPPSQKAIWIAINNMTQSSGFVLGPIYSTAVYSSTGRWEDVFLFECVIMGSTMLIGLLFARSVFRLTRKRKTFSVSSLANPHASFGGSFVPDQLNQGLPQDFEDEEDDDDSEEERDGYKKQVDEKSPSPDKASPGIQNDDVELPNQQIVPASKMPIKQELKMLSQNGVFLLFLVGMFTSFYTFGAFSAFANFYLQKQFDMSVDEAAHVMEVINSVSGFVAVPIGALAYERLLKRRNPITRQYRCQIACAVLFWSYLWTAAIAIPCIIFQTKWVFIGGMAVAVSALSGSSAINTLACINSVPEENVNTAMSVNVISFNLLGSIPGPIVFGALSDTIGWHNAMIVSFMPMVIAVTTGFFTWICSCAPGYGFANQWAVFMGKTSLFALKEDKLLGKKEDTMTEQDPELNLN